MDPFRAAPSLRPLARATLAGIAVALLACAAAPVARRVPARAPARPAAKPVGALAQAQAMLLRARDARVAEENGAYATAVELLRGVRGSLDPDADLDLTLALDEARTGSLDSAAALLWTPLMDRAMADTLPATRRHFAPWIREPLWTNGRFDGWCWYVARARFEVAYTLKRWRVARRAAEACVNERPMAGTEWLALALAAGHDGDDSTAATAAGIAATLDPMLPEAQYVAGLYAWRAGQRGEAQERFNAAIALDSLARLPAVALMRSRLPGTRPEPLPDDFLTGERAVAMLTTPDRPKLEEFQQYDSPAKLAHPARVPLDSAWTAKLHDFSTIVPVLIDERGRAVICMFPGLRPDILPPPAVSAMVGSLPDWEFIPATKGGQPRKAWVSIPYKLQ